MKKILAWIVFVGLSTTLSAQTVFEDITFEQALSRAQSENKYVFVDCYASWCGPCHKMANEVFPQKNVGDYFNPRFISVKYDTEKTEDGKSLAKQYNIVALPTFLVFRADGSLIHKIVGSDNAEKFILKVEESFDSDRAYGAIRKLYETGNRDKEFLASCLRSFIALGDNDIQEVCRQLLTHLSDREKTTEDFWFIYTSEKLSPAGSPNEAFLMENDDDFRKNTGVEKVNKELYKRYKSRLLDIIRGKETIPSTELEKVVSRIQKLELREKQELEVYGYIATEIVNDDLDRLITVCDSYLPDIPETMLRYLEMSDRVIKKGISSQKQKWITIGEKLYAALSEEQKSRMEVFIKYVRDKVNAPSEK